MTALRESVTIVKAFSISLGKDKTRSTVLKEGAMITENPIIISLAKDSKFKFAVITGVKIKPPVPKKDPREGGTHA